MSLTIQTEILLPATPDAVWAVLTDFAQYPKWNPFIREIKGALVADGKLCVKWAPTLSWTMWFGPTVVALQPGLAFAWAGGPACLFRGRHFFELQSSEDGLTTRLIQGEIFSGMLARPLIFLLGKDPARGYRAMNEALKIRLRQH